MTFIELAVRDDSADRRIRRTGRRPQGKERIVHAVFFQHDAARIGKSRAVVVQHAGDDFIMFIQYVADGVDDDDSADLQLADLDGVYAEAGLHHTFGAAELATVAPVPAP